ncbi:WD40 repeat-containing protein [Cynara cardunculus var. scolymus]|uniref:WD40 repeat-containing protein n=1 Tax=Cynara cardunculus var. scolymus TaxID=59895 RepID=A0A103XIW0_CYNCS|nr:WD40 repeat-containing protein [Cynara cardunculus var. scolymus]
MIAAISWVPKGASKAVPSAADPPSKEELEEIKKNVLVEKGVGVESEEDEEDMSVDASKEPADVEQALGAANALGKLSVRKAGGSELPDITDAIDIFGSGIADTFYPSNELDPYIKDKDDDDDSEELEDIIIKAEDAVVVWIIEDPDGDSNMYVHHDILIPAFPLCTAWLDCPIKGGEKGNFIAVGSMEPAIEIWDLDIMDEVQPSLILGGVAEQKKKKKKNGKKVEKSIKYKEDSHTDAVLGLAWNKGYRNILASASADKLVKIWDVATGKCKITMEHHTDKANSVFSSF